MIFLITGQSLILPVNAGVAQCIPAGGRQILPLWQFFLASFYWFNRRIHINHGLVFDGGAGTKNALSLRLRRKTC
jgi:hypothetical protein